MLFLTCEHYDDNQCIRSFFDKQYECFVCFEVMTELELSPIRLKSNARYNKKCCCDGWIHERCFDLWYNTQKKCPICRHEILRNDNKKIVVVENKCKNKRIDCIIRYLSQIKNIFVYLFVAYMTIEFYLVMAATKNIIKDNNET